MPTKNWLTNDRGPFHCLNDHWTLQVTLATHVTVKRRRVLLQQDNQQSGDSQQMQCEVLADSGQNVHCEVLIDSGQTVHCEVPIDSGQTVENSSRHSDTEPTDGAV